MAVGHTALPLVVMHTVQTVQTVQGAAAIVAVRQLVAFGLRRDVARRSV
jgi:hypothetical protein